MNRKEILEKLGDQELQQFFELYQRLKEVMENGMKEEHNRRLPIGELLSDRWERAAAIGFGKGSSVYETCIVFGNVKVGEHTWIGPYSVLDGTGGLEIGNYCSVGAGVQIYTHDSMEWAITGGNSPYVYSPTKIGDNCFIAPNCIIARGVEIGSGTVIGANSFVNRSFPANSRIAGSPARPLVKGQGV